MKSISCNFINSLFFIKQRTLLSNRRCKGNKKSYQSSNILLTRLIIDNHPIASLAFTAFYNTFFSKVSCDGFNSSL